MLTKQASLVLLSFSGSLASIVNTPNNIKMDILNNPQSTTQPTLIKVGLSPSKKNYNICFMENPIKMMKIGFYFILKAPFVLRIFKFLS